jgi:hypothetical protein
LKSRVREIRKHGSVSGVGRNPYVYSTVPFILAYPGGNKYILQDIINKVCPTGCDGNWKTTEVIKQIIETQYSGQ